MTFTLIIENLPDDILTEIRNPIDNTRFNLPNLVIIDCERIHIDNKELLLKAIFAAYLSHKNAKLKEQSVTDELELLSCPGDTIKETYECMEMDNVEFAKQMEMGLYELDDLISGKTSLTEDIAIKLAKVLLIPAHFWVNREKNYRDKLAEIMNQAKAE